MTRLAEAPPGIPCGRATRTGSSPGTLLPRTGRSGKRYPGEPHGVGTRTHPRPRGVHQGSGRTHPSSPPTPRAPARGGGAGSCCESRRCRPCGRWEPSHANPIPGEGRGRSTGCWTTSALPGGRPGCLLRDRVDERARARSDHVGVRAWTSGWRRSGSAVPACGERRSPPCRPPSASARGTRECAAGADCAAETFVSWSSPGDPNLEVRAL